MSGSFFGGGLTSPVAVADGGTGGTTQATARAGLGIAGAALPVRLVLINSQVNWTNQPAAQTELTGASIYRRAFDSTNAVSFLLSLYQSTAGASGAYLGLQYSTDAGSTWLWADDGTTSASGACSAHGGCAAGTGNGVKSGSKTTLHSGARGSSILFRVVGDLGDGVADPQYFYVAVDFYLD